MLMGQIELKMVTLVNKYFIYQDTDHSLIQTSVAAQCQVQTAVVHVELHLTIDQAHYGQEY